MVEQCIASIKKEQLIVHLTEFEEPTLVAVCMVAENFFLVHKDDRSEGLKGSSHQSSRKEMAPKEAQLVKPRNKPVNAESETTGSSSRDAPH